MRIGLFFGSYNPVHTGHMIIANHMVQETDLDQIWLVVSPHNPLKDKKSLANDYDRLHLVHLAIGENTRLRASDIEFHLPQPSYTVDTLAWLTEKHPEHEWVLIMGGDNLSTIHKWKNYELLLEQYSIYVYKRRGHDIEDLKDHPSVWALDVPFLEISASFIRKQIHKGRSVRYLVPDAVYEYLEGSSMYKKGTGKR